MPLTTRQSEDLKSAVASYLRELGADKAFNTFVEEKNVNNVSCRFFTSSIDAFLVNWEKIPRPSRKEMDHNS